MKTIICILSYLFLSSFAFAQDAQWADGDLSNFVDFVAQKTGKTILYDSSLKGKKLFLHEIKAKTQEDWFKVFQSVIEYYGYILEETGKDACEIVKIKRNITGPWTSTPTIRSLEELEKVKDEDRFVTMVIPLEHAKSREVQTVLRALRLVNPQAGNLAGIDTSNTVLITDYAPNVKRIYDVIKMIDCKKKEEIAPVPTNVVFPLENQTISLYPKDIVDVCVDVQMARNASFVMRTADQKVLLHLDPGSAPVRLRLNPYLKQSPTVFHFEIDTLENHETHFEVGVKFAQDVEHKRSYQAWFFGIKRPLPAGKSIRFSLSFEGMEVK